MRKGRIRWNRQAAVGGLVFSLILMLIPICWGADAPQTGLKGETQSNVAYRRGCVKHGILADH